MSLLKVFDLIYTFKNVSFNLVLTNKIWNLSTQDNLQLLTNGRAIFTSLDSLRTK